MADAGQPLPPGMDAELAQRLEQAYFERRETLAQEWAAYTNKHGPRLVLRPGADPVQVRASLFEAWCIDQLAQLQVLAQEESLRRRGPGVPQ